MSAVSFPERPRALALMAHPDDIEFVAAGTLLLLATARAHMRIGIEIDAKRRIGEHHAALIATLGHQSGMLHGCRALPRHHLSTHLGAHGHARDDAGHPLGGGHT